MIAGRMELPNLLEHLFVLGTRMCGCSLCTVTVRGWLADWPNASQHDIFVTNMLRGFTEFSSSPPMTDTRI